MKLMGFVLAALLTGFPVVATENPAPFPDVALLDSEGASVPIRSLFGKATVLNFWATWCGPCRIELPELQRLHNDLAGQGLVLLAINVDSPRSLVKRFLEKGNITLPSYFLSPETERALGITRLPFTVLLDGQGRVVQVYTGYSAEGMDDLRRRVKLLLAR